MNPAWQLLRLASPQLPIGGYSYSQGLEMAVDSGLVQAPGVVKPELDVRGVRRLSLRTLGAQSTQGCGNWANAVLIGQEGDIAEWANQP